MNKMAGRLGSLIGFVLVVGFFALILYKTRELPLIVICSVISVMVLWHAIEEEWTGGTD